MDTSNGKVYANRDEALKDGARKESLVEISGTPEQIEAVSKAVISGNRAQRRAQEKSARTLARRVRAQVLHEQENQKRRDSTK